MVQTATVPPSKLEDLFTIASLNAGLYISPRNPGEEEPSNTTLSQEELEVLQYMADGNTKKIVGHLLQISEQTVKNHLTSIRRKLETSTSAQEAVLALWGDRK